MGLRRRWTSCAVAQAHALVVEVPGWWSTRVAVEQDLVRRGWQVALSPADADVLVVCGEPDGPLADAVDRVWDQLPGPRAHVVVTGPEVHAALDRAAVELADDDRQRDDARRRPDVVGEDVGHGEDAADGSGEGDMDHGDTDHGDREMAPAGIPLASGTDDRDGLEMDVLHVPLGPVLPHWPAGLVLRCVLHGDVVAGSEIAVLGGRGVPPPAAATALPVLGAAADCDAAARLLAVAGWADAAAGARRIRDEIFGEGAVDDPVGRQALRQLDRLRSRVARSWLLRWQLRGLGPLDDDAVRAHGLPDGVRGDVHDRLVGMLDRARSVLRGEPARPARDPAAVLAALPDIVAGLELAAVRLVVASLDPDTAATVRREHARA